MTTEKDAMALAVLAGIRDSLSDVLGQDEIHALNFAASCVERNQEQAALVKAARRILDYQGSHDPIRNGCEECEALADLQDAMDAMQKEEG